MIYGHGDNAYEYGGQVKTDFSSNIPHFAELGPLRQHLAEHLGLIASYPEPQARQLEELIAADEGLTPSQVMVTAGATEAIYLVAQLYRGWASVIPQPTFSEYEDACKMHAHIVSYYDNDDMEQLPPQRLYWLCNPNNPTGNVLMKELIGHLVRTHREYIFVIDQSYEDYTPCPMLRSSEMQDCHNLILLHSMTKRYCIPGLRLGYITASPVIIRQLRQLRQPWTVNALAIEAGHFLVGNHVDVLPRRQEYLDEAQRLHAELSQLKGVNLMDSHANFMLAYLETANARDLQTWLLRHHGMLIRNASNFHGLDSHCFRVAAQTPGEDDALVRAIAEFLDDPHVV